MREDRLIWDRRYTEGIPGLEGSPAPYLIEWLPFLPRGRALDLAAGCGRHSIYLAQHGYRVDAFDISLVALTRLMTRARRYGLRVRPAVVDLDDIVLPSSAYDLIVDALYLNRALHPQLIRALVPGGALLVETRFYDPQHDRPEKATHRPRRGELAAAFEGLDVAHYEEVETTSACRDRRICHMVAFRPVAPPRSPSRDPSEGPDDRASARASVRETVRP